VSLKVREIGLRVGEWFDDSDMNEVWGAQGKKQSIYRRYHLSSSSSSKCRSSLINMDSPSFSN
jgi:hypothetical protein